jgi:hypothetical protein
MKLLNLGVALILFVSGPAEGRAEDYRQYLPPIEESRAYQQYTLRPKTELSKLLYLMDRFRDSKFEVIFDGTIYKAPKAINLAKSYIAEHYDDEEAKQWVKQNAYRSITRGEVIYVKDPKGKRYQAKDVLLEELTLLEKNDKTSEAEREVKK